MTLMDLSRRSSGARTCRWPSLVDEHGGVAGLVSLTDVMAAIIGELPSEPGQEPAIVRREDGSGRSPPACPAAVPPRGPEPLLGTSDRRHYHTLGGLAMLVLGRVPSVGDVFAKTALSVRNRGHGRQSRGPRAGGAGSTRRPMRRFPPRHVTKHRERSQH